MRTTIDMPDTLMRAAKARAAEHGESLKDLVNRALAHELGLQSVLKRKTGRVALPLIARDATPAILVTNDDIANALDAKDVERYSAS
jgi:plasmid stability protein